MHKLNRWGIVDLDAGMRVYNCVKIMNPQAENKSKIGQTKTKKKTKQNTKHRKKQKTHILMALPPLPL